MKGSQERDQAVDQWLRQRLQTPQLDRGAESCLDAEALAAWIDGGLSGAALEMTESHVADCTRCQTVAATLARINVVVPPATNQHLTRRWLAWLAPLTAAAAALALWVAVPRDARAPVSTNPAQRETNPSQREVAETKGPKPASADEPPPARLNRPSDAKLDAVTRKERADSVPRAPAPSVRSDVGQLEAANQQRPQEASDAGAPPASAAATRAAPAAATPLLADKATGVARSLERRAEVSSLEIVSPDPSVRWRIVGSLVQRSTDGGARWEDRPTGLAVPLTAGAAPSSSVCWVVGPGGVVLLTTDGLNWRRVPFPEATDLSAVRATDARTASVSTTDRRAFSTIDGGATWTAR